MADHIVMAHRRDGRFFDEIFRYWNFYTEESCKVIYKIANAKMGYYALIDDIMF